ncbi:MAG: hypothetical protein OEM79_05760 [Nitrosopumilus sp.]|nr:hypothetical protein [Nitrosopumilus sp.]
MKRELVMQIDATVIIGVIILMTFQSFSSNAFEKQYGEIITESRLAYSEYYVIAMELQECEAGNSTNCGDLVKELTKIELKQNGTKQWVKELDIADSFEEFFSNVTFFSIGGSLIANVVNLAMVIPFAISAIIESVRVLRGDTDSEASRRGVVAMMIGFGMVLVGFISIILLMTCATVVRLDCFGVNNWYPLPQLPPSLKP